MEVIKKFNYKQYATLEERAKWFAYYHHGVTLHMYNGKPYHEAHLAKVVEVAKRYIYYIHESQRDLVLAACWAHDTIEDTRVTFNDVSAVLGERVAEIVYALTNEKGRNRKERANRKYYRGIMDTTCATFVKLCDRIANIEASVDTGGRMLDLYRNEHLNFANELSDGRYELMWDQLVILFTHMDVAKE